MSRDDIAIDQDGHPLPYGPDEVQRIVQRALEQGDVLAAVFKTGGDLAIQVFGPPSQEIADALDIAARAYREALRGH